MIKKFRKSVLSIAAVLLLAVFLSATPAIAANCCSATNLTAKQQIQCGADTASGNSCTPTPGKGVENTVKEVINILSLAGGALAVIMIIVGGLRYVTSAGNQESTKAAKNTIIYAVVGLVIIAVAQIIVQFVLNKATNP